MSDDVSATPNVAVRRRGWLDGLILLLAGAFGLLIAARWTGSPQAGLWLHAQRAWVVLTMLSLALVVVRWVGPRPMLAPGQLGPGDAACLGVLVSVALMLLARLPGMILFGTYYGQFTIEYLRPFFDDRRPAIGVSTAWLMLRLTKGWAPVGDWVDRAGMAAGTAWIALATIVPVANTIWAGR